MKKTIISFTILAFLLLTGCTVPQRYFRADSLNYISIGYPKSTIMEMFKSQKYPGGVVPGMQIRAAQRSSNGKIIEVGEVMITDGVTYSVPYWFLFEDSKLVQWGRPEDWKAASMRYDINFNPSPGVSR